MLTPRLRLYTKNSSYLRMLQGLAGLIGRSTITDTEKRIAHYTGAKHAVLTSMGRMAIYEGLCALEKKGEIILSPITVPEVISMVTLAGFTPVFCDVKPGTWNMDVDQIKPLITDKTVAIMTTHFYGNMNTASAVRRLCDAHKLIMIEDAAQAAGSWIGGKHAGTIGDFGIISFSYPKNITSFYGGCLLTNDDTIAVRVRESIATYPEVDRRWLYKRVLACFIKDICTFPLCFQPVALLIRYGYKHNIPAIKGLVTQELSPKQLTELPARYRTQISPAQAKVIADKLPEIDEDAAHRIACAKTYAQHLQDVPEVIFPEIPEDRSHTFLYVPVQVADKYALQHYLIEQYCDVAIQHAANCADLEAYSAYARDCPNARAAYAGTLMLPAWRGFPLAKAEQYAKTIRRFFAS